MSRVSERDYVSENPFNHNHKVCPKHFNKACLGPKGLKKFTLPSIHNMPELLIVTSTLGECLPIAIVRVPTKTYLTKQVPNLGMLCDFKSDLSYAIIRNDGVDHLDVMIVFTSYNDAGATSTSSSTQEQHMITAQNLGAIDGREVGKSPA